MTVTRISNLLGKITVLLVICCCCFARTASALDWIIQTIDDAHSSPTSLALDSDGNPHMSYISKTGTSFNLRYAFWNGQDWNLQTAVTCIEPASFGATSLGLDNNGTPHIAYASNFGINYTTLNGSQWNGKLLDEVGPGAHIGLKLDSSGNPHISYHGCDSQGYGSGLSYAKWNGSSWRTEQLMQATQGILGFSTQLDLDKNDRPHFSYFSGNSSDKYTVRHGTLDGSGWSDDIIEMWPDRPVFGWTSLALGEDDNAHMSYYDGDDGVLKYAVQIDSTWITEIVDSAADVGVHSSLAIDYEGIPHISYYDNTNGDLKYATWDETRWSVQSIDTVGAVGRNNSIALDYIGNIHISYYDSTNHALKYAFAEIPEPATLLLLGLGAVMLRRKR